MYSNEIAEAFSTANRICGELMADTATSCRWVKRRLDDDRLKYYQLKKRRRELGRKDTTKLTEEEIEALELEKLELEKEIKALELKIWGVSRKIREEVI